MDKYLTLFFFIILFACTIAAYKLIVIQKTKKNSEAFCITPYDDDRDRQAVLSIINRYPQYLSYEFAGKPDGTTEKYLTGQNNFSFVLRKNKQTIGFISCEYASKKKQGSIVLIGIDNNNQRRGYGRMLLEHALDHLQKLNALEVSLIVNHDNKNAQRMYENAGFTVVSKAPELRVWCYTKKLGPN